MVREVFIKFEEFLYETDKAILVQYRNKEVWFPKAFCRNIIINKKMKGNMIVRSFIMEKKGFDIDSEEPATIIERHIPKKKNKKNTDYDDSLFKPADSSN